MAQEPDTPALRKDAGNYFLKTKDYEKARDQYLAALKLDPDFSDAHYNLAVLYFFRLYDYEKALYHFVRYAELNPTSADLDKVKGLAIQSLEKIEEKDRETYEAVLKVGTIGALENFAEKHESSPYAGDALLKIEALKNYENKVKKRKRAIQASYDEALSKGTPEAMAAFLAIYPNAPQSEEAKALKNKWTEEREQKRIELEKIKEVPVVEEPGAINPEEIENPSPEVETSGSEETASEEIAEEPISSPEEETPPPPPTPDDGLTELERAWRNAQKEGTKEAYENFLKEYPEGEEADAARALLEEMSPKAEPVEGLTREKRKALKHYRKMLKEEN